MLASSTPASQGFGFLLMFDLLGDAERSVPLQLWCRLSGTWCGCVRSAQKLYAKLCPVVRRSFRTAR